MPRGPKPDPGKANTRNTRRNTHAWRPAPGVGWQHGHPTAKSKAYPDPPDTIAPAYHRVWATWFESEAAAFWKLSDVPTVELAIELYQRVMTGQVGPEKLTPYLDRLGLTEKGRQDNRWLIAPAEPEPTAGKTQAKADELAAARAARRKRGVG